MISPLFRPIAPAPPPQQQPQQALPQPAPQPQPQPQAAAPEAPPSQALAPPSPPPAIAAPEAAQPEVAPLDAGQPSSPQQPPASQPEQPSQPAAAPGPGPSAGSSAGGARPAEIRPADLAAAPGLTASPKLRLDAAPLDDVALARASALEAQAAFKRQAMIDALARAPEVVQVRLLDGSRRRDTEAMVPPQLVPAVFAAYPAVRGDAPSGTRVQPAVGGDTMRGQTRR